MPIYVYGCQKCGATEEHIQKFSDPPVEQCESCGGPLQKQVTSAAFHLKGGGWYKDGYASSGGGASDSGSAASGSSDKKAKSADSDSKKSSKTSDSKSKKSTSSSASSSKSSAAK